jgi:transcription elongation factor Elf1
MNQEEITCPYCGHIMDISSCDLWYLFEESDTHEVTCYMCEKEFDVESTAIWSFESVKKDDEDE